MKCTFDIQQISLWWS